jgi:hypothetical protein
MISIDVSIMIESVTPSLPSPVGRGFYPLSQRGRAREGACGNPCHIFTKLNSSRGYLDEQSNLRWLPLSALYRYACRLKNYREVPLEILEDSVHLAACAKWPAIP